MPVLAASTPHLDVRESIDLRLYEMRGLPSASHPRDTLEHHSLKRSRLGFPKAMTVCSCVKDDSKDRPDRLLFKQPLNGAQEHCLLLHYAHIFELNASLASSAHMVFKCRYQYDGECCRILERIEKLRACACVPKNTYTLA